MYLLRKIEFYTKKDYYLPGTTTLNPSRVPIRVAHFVYDYSLCSGIPNFSASVVGASATETGTGKLTLKKVYFTYRNSNKARLSPYEFTYDYGTSTTNYAYNPKAYDRWGNYKASTGNCGAPTDPLTAAEFSYVKQDQTTANNYTVAWNLTQIILPSGGKINIEYESDDYAYVQDKRAMQMFKVVGWGDLSPSSVSTSISAMAVPKDNKYLFFELQPGITDINKYIEGVDKVYFKCLMNVLNTSTAYDYVFGYAELDPANCGTVTYSSTTYGYIKLKGVKFDDHDASGGKHPIVRAAVQFSRLYLSRQLYGDPMTSEATSFGESLITEFFESGIIKSTIENLVELVQGPNDFGYTKGAGKNVMLGKSWIRLNNPNKKKLGGGCRVKKILMNDSWNNMSSGSASEYGQEYLYTLPDGTSSGVASYEPQLGGEENPFKQPVSYDIKNALAPDTKMYQETPFGESFFPSPSVGYSMVTIKDIARTDVMKHARGKVVHEFYTAKDFPTIVNRTDVEAIPEQQDPFSISSLLNVRTKSYLTATQGFSIEVNDMHGKHKMQSIYAEDQVTPITSVEYKYKCSAYGTSSFVLNNSVTVISPNGSQSTATIGQFFDMVADMREERSFGESSKTMLNLDVFMLAVVPAFVPALWPSLTSEESQFRSATTTKLIQRFGILEETIAKDLGSVVSTKILAYDSETGDVLLTQATTDFNDPIYSLSYPAHWYYDKGLGQAYKNIGLAMNNINFSGTGVATITNANLYFTPGDELKLSNGLKAWIVEVNPNSIKAMKKDGSAISGLLNIKVIRSGRRNMASTPVSNITTLTNPLTNFQSNIFSNVLDASSIEYSDDWRTFCDCFGITDINTSVNPYVLGTKGNWRMKKAYTYLTPRTQSNYNNNTNIRKDGVFTSFTPFYKIAGGKWEIDGKNWTFGKQSTEFSPFGQLLESNDALGRYTAATYGYRQSYAISTAINSRYRDIGYDNFEDYGWSPCADNHFKFVDFSANVDDTKSHSGKKSMKVSSGTPVTMDKTLTVCNPVAACNISLTTINYSSLNKDVYTIHNGTGPYNISYNVIYGTPEVNLSVNEFSLIGTSYKVEIIITDNKGCKLTQMITKP